MRARSRILSLAVLAFVCWVWRATGTTYYVDYQGGSDTYDGRYPTYQGGTKGPWKRLSKVSDGSFAPGDSVLFKRGASWNGTLTVPSSGAPGSPITFGAYGDAADPKPRFSVVSTASSGWTSEGDGIYSRNNGLVYGLFEDGAKLVESDQESGVADPLLANGDWDYASASSTLYYRPSSGHPSNHTIQIGYSYYGIRAYGKSYVDFENLDIRYVGGGGFSIRDGSHHVNVTRCDISFIYGGAVSFEDTAGHCSVNHCTITKVGDGVYFVNLPGDYHVVRGNTITYCNYEEYNNNDGHAVGVQNTSYTIIEDNVFSYCRSPTGVWVANGQTSVGNVYRRNVMTDCRKTYRTSHAGVAIVCGPGDDHGVTAAKVYGNIIARCNFGIKFNKPASPGNKIFNNTLYDCGEGLKLSKGADGNVYKNNIVAESDTFMVNSEHWENGSHNLFTHNCYYPDLANGWEYRSGTRANFAAWQAANPAYNDPSPGSFVADPLFVDTNSFELAGGSPCVDAGDWLTTVSSPTANGQTTFVADDATWFCDGYGIAGQTGDRIETEHGQTATITSIDYAANRITVSPGIDIVQGEGLALEYDGAAPDMGAGEYGGYSLLPAAPSEPAALAVSETGIALSWRDNSVNEEQFKIDRRQSMTTPWVRVATLGPGTTVHTDTGLPPDTKFYYKIKAWNSAGNSFYSDVVSAMTPSGPIPPAAPSGLATGTVSVATVALSWQDNSVNEAAFKIDRRRSYTDMWVRVATLGPGTTAYTDTDLPEDTKFYYKVKAWNTAGNSAYSEIAAATTPLRVEGIGCGAVWRYAKGTTEASAPADSWRRPGYDDSGWAEGPAPFGYGDGPYGTELAGMQDAYTSLFLRRTFEIRLPAEVTALELDALYDDGFVIWLNGLEIARVNVPGAPGTCPAYDATAESTVVDGTAWTQTFAGGALPVLGQTNTVAVMVLNRSLSSSDLTFELGLVALRGTLAVAEDPDRDRIPDAWELAYFADAGLPAGADPDNDGLLNIEEFILGTDPGSETGNWKVEIGGSGGPLTVSFQTVAATGPGYTGRSRHYALEQRIGESSAWQAVPGHGDVLGAGQTVRYTNDAPQPTACYRARVWLE